MQSIINLNQNKTHVSIVLIDSEVTFLRERDDAAFFPFLYCVLFIDSIT